MRRSISVITILLLATAAAAGAGIKWTRAKDLEYHSPETDPNSYVSSKDEYNDMYMIIWKNSNWGADIGGMAALYVDWSVFRVNHRSLTGKRQWKKVDVEAWRGKFERNYYFMVVISASDKPESRLSNRLAWTVYLEADGNRLEPEAITPVAGAESESSQTMTYIGAPSLSNKFLYFNNGYFVKFVKMEAEAKPRNLKLVITGDKATRGFEWRFVEE